MKSAPISSNALTWLDWATEPSSTWPRQTTSSENGWRCSTTAPSAKSTEPKSHASRDSTCRQCFPCLRYRRRAGRLPHGILSVHLLGRPFKAGHGEGDQGDSFPQSLSRARLRSCTGIISLGKRFSQGRLEAARIEQSYSFKCSCTI